eukprot:Pompholyxophrys_sp_v1_NODE_29_length_3693_cov_2.397746.p1 type:complete len:377 gc:universal NODE_29_length_3693_cov_2.397746:3207-2077(-)
MLKKKRPNKVWKKIITWQEKQKSERRRLSIEKQDAEKDEAEFYGYTLMTDFLLNQNLNDVKTLGVALYFHFLSKGFSIKNALDYSADIIDYHANTLRVWRDEYLEDGAFVESARGRNVKVPWLLEDEDLQKKARQFIRANANKTGEPNMTSVDFAHYLNTDLLKDVVIMRKKELSNMTALTYIKRLGFTVQVIGKNTFIDGHGREDVVQYRQQEFLPKILDLQKRARLWTPDGQFIDCVSDDSKEFTSLRDLLPGGGCFHPDKPYDFREVIFVSQDESTGKAGSMQRVMYAEEGKAVPAKKNEGGSFMISGFALEQGTGRISFTDEEYATYLNSLRLPDGVFGPLPRPLPQDADVYIEIGKNKEGYWDSDIGSLNK